MTPEPSPTTPPSTPPLRERGFVWHATLTSKQAGKISLLAVVETVLACAGYWWFAFHFDTHWHLLISIVIAPLLLLRSPESIKQGVDWFLAEPFKDWKNWSQRGRFVWNVLLASLGGGVAWFICDWVNKAWLPGASFGVLAVLAVWIVVAVVVASVGAGAGTGAFARSLAVTGAGAGAVIGAGPSAPGGAVAVAVAVIGAIAATGAVMIVVGPGFAIGYSIRSLCCRFAATFRHAWTGLLLLPANWRENNFIVDYTLYPELMPGVRERDQSFALEGLLFARENSKEWTVKMVLYPAVAVVMFVPTLLYRFSMKTTAWFWWPLAMLLKPVPAEGVASGERDRLTWPWRDPFQKTWIVFSFLLAVVTLPGHFLSVGELMRSLLPSAGKVEGVPFLFRVAQALGWDGIRPWHWAAAGIAVCSVGMLWIAGRAVQKDTNGHWPAYQQAGLRRDLWCMDMLKRLRLLATLFFWGTGLLALLLETKVIPEKIPLPARQTEALREWFAGRTP